MKKKWFTIPVLLFTLLMHAQQKNLHLTKGTYGDGPDSIAPVGVLPGLTDEQ
jgi:hypothetical protein